MHSIAISPGVEDSAHLRTLSSSPISPSPPSLFHPPPSSFALSFLRVARRRGWGALEGSCIQLITPPGLITSRPGSRPTYNANSNPQPLASPCQPSATSSRVAQLVSINVARIPCENFRRKLAWRIRDNNCDRPRKSYSVFIFLILYDHFILNIWS